MWLLNLCSCKALPFHLIQVVSLKRSLSLRCACLHNAAPRTARVTLNFKLLSFIVAGLIFTVFSKHNAVPQNNIDNFVLPQLSHFLQRPKCQWIESFSALHFAHVHSASRESGMHQWHIFPGIFNVSLITTALKLLFFWTWCLRYSNFQSVHSTKLLWICKHVLQSCPFLLSPSHFFFFCLQYYSNYSILNDGISVISE